MELRIGNLDIKYNGKKLIGPLNCSFADQRLNLVVGPSGCGKSTFMKTIAGFHKEFTGALTLDNEYYDPRGIVAFAFQNPESLFFNSTVFDEIAYALTIRNLAKEKIKNMTEHWMEKWGLKPEKYSNRYPFNLSGGEKRRVALAATTIFNPKIILLDEPLAGLDYRGQTELASIITNLSKNAIVVVVTHEPELLMNENSSIFHMHEDGSQQITTDEFLRLSLSNEDYYPLPNWYKDEILPFINCDYELPMINAIDVFDFLEQVRNA